VRNNSSRRSVPPVFVFEQAAQSIGQILSVRNGEQALRVAEGSHNIRKVEGFRAHDQRLAANGRFDGIVAAHRNQASAKKRHPGQAV
jgi:hypothetical protein